MIRMPRAWTLLLAAPLLLGASWEDESVDQWSLAQVQDFMIESPWAVRISQTDAGIGRVSVAPAELPEDHPMFDAVTADIARWEPGVAPEPGVRKKKIPARKRRRRVEHVYYARWYSAHVVREALVRGAQLAENELTPPQQRQLLKDDDRYYVITLSGPGLTHLNEVSFEVLRGRVTLELGNGESFPLIDIRRPRELGGTAEAMFFFDRSAGSIPPDTHRATFVAELGTARFEADFNPRQMVFQGQSDISGVPPADDDEALRRHLESVLVAGADPAFKRGLANTELRRGAPDAKPDLIVLYDSSREDPDSSTAEPFRKRMRDAGLRVGHDMDGTVAGLRTFWFIDVATGQQAYVRGQDCLISSRLQPGAAEEYFDSRIQTPR